MSSVQTVINSVRHLINDEAASSVSGYRWSDAELIGWVNEAQRAIVKLKPEANPVTATHTVTTDSARQRIDSSLYYKLLRVEGHVYGSAGAPPSISALAAVTFERTLAGGNTAYVGGWSGLNSVSLSRYPVAVFVGAIRQATAVHGITLPTVTLGGVAATVHTFDYDDGEDLVAMVVAVAPLHGQVLSGSLVSVTFAGQSLSGIDLSAFCVLVYDGDSDYQQPFDVAANWAAPSPVDGTALLATVPVNSLVLGFAIAENSIVGVSGTSGAYTGDSVEFDFGGVPHSLAAGYRVFTSAAVNEIVSSDGPTLDVAAALLFRGTAASTIVGDAIRVIERDVLDTFLPSWISSPGVHGVSNDMDRYKNYVLDASDPLAFWLFPYPASGANVVITASGIPVTLASVGDSLTLSDMYLDHLVDYVSSRALSKDTRGGAKERADSYYNKFLSALGAGRQIIRSVGQGVARPPGAEE